MRNLRFAGVLAALLFAFVAISVSPGRIQADDCDPPANTDQECTIAGGTDGASGSSGPTDDPWYIVVGTFYQYTSSDIKYYRAYTQRTQGTGAHELEVHGALVKDWGGDFTTVYSFGPVIEHDGFVVGGEDDSWHDIDGVTWGITSGHYYDDGDDGTIDWTCDGCNDYFHP